MRTFALAALRRFWEAGHGDAEGPLKTWYATSEQANWSSFREIRMNYPSADLVAGKVIFNIGGNKYRLICKVPFGKRSVFVKWVGTHAEYDRLTEEDIRKL